MQNKQSLHENRETSLRVLVDYILNSSGEKQLIYFHDFASKLKYVRSEAQHYYLAKILLEFINPKFREILRGDKMPEVPPKSNVDLAIVTIKKPELLASKLAFDIVPIDKKEDKEDKGYRYWETEVPCKGLDRPGKVVITMVAQDRNVNCANACHVLFNNYDVKICILVGIGAGLKSKVKIGDIVASESVWDYEGARLEVEGPKKRPDVDNMTRYMSRDIQYFSPKISGWEEFYAEKLGLLKEYETIPKEINDKWKPKFHTGVIISGEKLVANGETLPKLQAEDHERIRVLDMEGTGFARACNERGVSWLVIRGISDYGDPITKNGVDPATESRKLMQPIASLGAATIAYKFFEHEYREREDKLF